LTALAWNRDPRQIQTRRRSHSAGAQSALGRQPAIERVFKPTLQHLADRIGPRLRAKSLAGRTITVRVRFADLRAVTRSITLSAPISATRALAEVAEDLVRGALADHREERTISLLAISVSNLEAHPIRKASYPASASVPLICDTLTQCDRFVFHQRHIERCCEHRPSRREP
jgi:DNA polymerase-4